MTSYTIWNYMDDEGRQLEEGACYALYPPLDDLPGVGHPMDAVQIAGEIAWYAWNDEAATMTFVDSDGEQIDLGRVDYAHRQS